MEMRTGRGWRGLLGCAWLVAAMLASPVSAQPVQEGAARDGSGGVVALASGDMHSCGLRSDGTIACWGANDFGQATPPAGHFIALTAGRQHSCGLRDDGKVLCWGADATTPPDEEWRQSAALAAGGRFACALDMGGEPVCWGAAPQPAMSGERLTAISAGGNHACGLRGDGMALCWGDNSFGQASPPWQAFTALSSNFNRTCGLQADGHVQCWGDVAWFEVPDERFTAITLGGSHACGLREDRTAVCWGGGPEMAPPSGRFIALSAGMAHTCGLRTDGHVVCWGINWAGQATPPDDTFGFGHLAAGHAHTCQVRADGILSCWGQNDQGQLDAPQPQPWESWRYAGVDAGSRFTCARRDDGPNACWGSNESGETSPGPDALWGRVGLGWAHGCGLDVNGLARCWGWDENSQTTPPAEVFRSVSTGFVHSCGLRADGTAACWGYGGDQQLLPPPAPWGQSGLSIVALEAGDWGNCGLFTNSAVNCTGFQYGSSGATTLDLVRALSGNSSHVCVIHTDGQLECRGSNNMDQVAVPPGRFVSITSGLQHSCAIRSDGVRVCWGDDSQGQYPHLEVEPRQLPPIRRDQPFQFPMQLYSWSNGNGPSYGPVPGTFAITWGALPPGLTMDANGQVSGTPLVGGLFPVIIEGRDANGFTGQSYLILRVDGTPPSIEPRVTGTLGDNGWYVGDVEITWLLSDDESWVYATTGCDWAWLSSDSPAAGFSCMAESTGGSATRSVSIKRDATAPDTNVTGMPAAETGEHNATFVFSGSDAMAGVDRFECSLDGAGFTPCMSPAVYASLADGAHSFAVRAIDAAGNRDATAATHAWRIDATPPAITPIVSGTLGSNGWYTGNVSISWSVHDAESAVSSTGCNSVVLSTDTPGAGFVCSATSAGGTSSRTVTVKRDATAPAITAVATSAPNAAGWYRTDVGVAFACSDALSGVTSCPPAQVLAGEGEAVSSAVRTVTDAAGNSAVSNTVTVRIDRTAPTLAPVVSPETLMLNATGAAVANGGDTLSGIATQSCAALATASAGDKSTSCVVTDRAGNTASGNAAYRVVYAFNGFSAPVQNLPVLNVIKAGRSIPLRWRVLDAQGAPVSNLATASVNAVPISCPSASENRISTHGGSIGQLQNLGNGYYQLDWMAASSLRNSCRRLDLDLGDGQLHSAQFKFN
ncbi:PxKF domain-containing protein [Lysobacter niabensis]|uniref:PxKF domain-containing protein n=1 Tax=Agrilutibacter niabensis TaxID=380628 RepID=UPI00361DFBE2